MPVTGGAPPQRVGCSKELMRPAPMRRWMVRPGYLAFRGRARASDDRKSWLKMISRSPVEPTTPDLGPAPFTIRRAWGFELERDGPSATPFIVPRFMFCSRVPPSRWFKCGFPWQRRGPGLGALKSGFSLRVGVFGLLLENEGNRV